MQYLTTHWESLVIIALSLAGLVVGIAGLFKK